MKFHGHLIPEYFTCTFYIIDNDGIKVTDQNIKTFKTWTLELTLRTTKSETVEIVNMSVQGAKKFTGHKVTLVSTTLPKPSLDNSSLTARHFNQIHENRSKLIAYSALAIIQTTKYTKSKVNGHIWTIGDYVEISETELQDLYSEIVDSTYKKLDGSFYQEFADRYKALILEGEKHPIKALQKIYYPFKSAKHVQSYATEARKRGLLAKPETTENSPVRKTRKKGK